MQARQARQAQLYISACYYLPVAASSSMQANSQGQALPWQTQETSHTPPFH
jgi:hypothetical protein